MINYQEKFWQDLFNSRSEYPPQTSVEGSFYMDLNSNIYVYLENRWQKTEAVQFDETSLDNSWAEDILNDLGI